MATATEIRATAMALTRSMSTPDLVKAMALSDTLMAGFKKDATGAPAGHRRVHSSDDGQGLHDRRPGRARRAASGDGMTTATLTPLPWKAALTNREVCRMVGPLLLVTSAQPSLETHTLDGSVHPNLGRLIQPRHTSSIERTAETGMPWAADNDCFQALNEKKYTAMLDRIQLLAASCLFVTVPDVVADAVATAKQFELWADACKRRGLPAALVAQDGLEDMGRWLAATWHRIDALFIGGSTEWKESQTAIDFADEARERGKWVHWGRVNTKRRFDLCVADHGDSFDGSKFARFRTTYLDGGLEWARAASDARIRREMDDLAFDAEVEHAG